MLKRNKFELAIYTTEMEEEIFPIEHLKDLLLKKKTEIIYVIQNEKLYGIVCLEDILHHSKDGKIPINKKFTKMVGFNVIKAHEIFQRRKKVHKIPVVDAQGKLLGDYSRWDDMLYVDRNQKFMMNKEIVQKVLGVYDAVYLAEPVEKKNVYYLSLLEYLKQAQISYEILEIEKVGEILAENAICIFLDEDERRGAQALYNVEIKKCDSLGFDISKDDLLIDTQLKIRFATYQSLIMQVIEESWITRLNIQKPKKLFLHGIDDKATVLFSALKANRIKCFAIHTYENEETEYRKNFWSEVHERLKTNPLNMKEPWPKEENTEFYGELYQLRDYKKEIAQREIFDAMFSFKYRSSVKGKYYNAKSGRRVTYFQPKEYVGTIYLVGLCIVIGAYVEDQYTIASYLQKLLLERGYKYRVENYGEMMRLDAALECRLQEIDEYSEDDIIVYFSGLGETIGVSGSSLEKIYEQNQTSSKWVVDGYGHCNNKVNQLIADNVFGMIQSSLSNEYQVLHGNKIQIDFQKVMADYIQHKYLDQYFGNFHRNEYHTVGVIVMKGDPFHKGHRHLIEQARKQVDFLIIFVMEKDDFVFSFEERFQMIVDGTRDIDNIMVVPNGDFVFSENTFWEYYRKREDETLVDNAEYDISIFADYIAKPLHITHRFAGEEPKRAIIKIYNETMKRRLPQKGITYVELPRIYLKGSQINSSEVRKCLRNEEYEKVFGMLPDTTKQYMEKYLR